MLKNKTDELAAEQVNGWIRSRRSVFPDQFEKGSVVSDETVGQLLENANWAPTHKRTEPWRFRVFTGEGLSAFARFQASRYKENSRERFRQDKFDKLLTNPMSCSHIIAIIMRRSIHTDIPEMEEIAAVACAVQNIWLSAPAHGLGGYWSTGGITFDPAAREFLELQEEDRLLGFFYLGVVKVPSPGATRLPIEEKIAWVRG
ncbi:MAG TPA: nitroreductase [Puia sp.]|nr:nitroreductase [Puia sp.]